MLQLAAAGSPGHRKVAQKSDRRAAIRLRVRRGGERITAVAADYGHSEARIEIGAGPFTALLFIACISMDCNISMDCYNGGRNGSSQVNFLRIIWDYEADGNVEHIDEHDLTTDDVEFVLKNATNVKTSQSSGRPCVFGYTPDDEYVIVVFEWVDDDTVLPVTAYEVPEP